MHKVSLLSCLWFNLVEIKPSKILCMSSLSSSLKSIDSLATEEKLRCLFSRYSMAVISVVSCWIWREFKLIQAWMQVLLTCKTEEDPIKNKRCLNDHNIIQYFRRSSAANPVVSIWIRPKLKLIQAFIHVLFTCKAEEDPMIEWPQHFSHYKYMYLGIFPNAQWQLTPQSVIRSLYFRFNTYPHYLQV